VDLAHTYHRGAGMRHCAPVLRRCSLAAHACARINRKNDIPSELDEKLNFSFFLVMSPVVTGGTEQAHAFRCVGFSYSTFEHAVYLQLVLGPLTAHHATMHCYLPAHSRPVIHCHFPPGCPAAATRCIRTQSWCMAQRIPTPSKISR
jgi:hypothetical protein